MGSNHMHRRYLCLCAGHTCKGEEMKADTLPLPEGLTHARYVDDMRELMQYDVQADIYKCRWDTVINGVREEYEAAISVERARDNSQAALLKMRQKAKEYFNGL